MPSLMLFQRPAGPFNEDDKMNHWAQINPAPDFNFLATTRRSQAATNVLPPNEQVGGADNADPNADQWLYVLAGSGRAVVANEAVDIGPGALVLIEAGEAHELRNLDEVPMETIHIYAPAAY